MTDVLAQIKTRGYRTIRIRPDRYEPNPELQLAKLDDAVRASAVSLRGWDFPHYDHKTAPIRKSEYVEQTLDWAHYVELWRAYRSKQFISVSGIPDDWRGRSFLWPPPDGWTPGTTLGVEDAIFRFIEVFEFAARWVTALKIDGSVTIAMEVFGLANRRLELGPNRMGFFTPRTAHEQSWSFSNSYSTADLLAKSRELSIPVATKLFELFGWDVSPDTIRGIQGELRG